MNLLNKQLLTELIKNKIFIFLMFLLSCFTSFMYFFVHFSVDGNKRYLLSLTSLDANQVLYLNALCSNTTLARGFLLASIPLTGFVFYMFFYRFFQKNSKQIGTLKALGYKDSAIQFCFTYFSFLISMLGGLCGLILGYFASDILLQAGRQSYEVTFLIKSANMTTYVIGILLPTFIFCLITYLTYLPNKNEDIALLLSPRNDSCTYPVLLRFAHKIANFWPSKNKLSIRLALRKPISLLLILVAVMSFSIMFIMAYSLNLSSQRVYDSQMAGRNYLLFDTHFDKPQTHDSILTDSMPYLATSATVQIGKINLTQQVVSFKMNTSIFSLEDEKGNAIPLPNKGEAVISPALQELYGLNPGDKITLCIDQKEQIFLVAHVAFNAELNTLYIASSDLEDLLSLPTDSYTGIWSVEDQYNGAAVITREQRIAELNRNFVSNHTSAIINQVIGCLIGAILLFLALLLNFQDSTRDMLILNLMGYKPPAIRRTLIDLYKPIVWSFFILTLWPSILIVKAILRSLSLQIGDYMPFQTNIFVILGIFILLNVVYLLVQCSFNLGIKKLIKADKLYEYTTNE